MRKRSEGFEDERLCYILIEDEARPGEASQHCATNIERRSRALACIQLIREEAATGCHWFVAGSGALESHLEKHFIMTFTWPGHCWIPEISESILIETQDIDVEIRRKADACGVKKHNYGLDPASSHHADRHRHANGLSLLSGLA